MIDSLEHLADPGPELREAARVLKPGAVVYIVTPDAGGWTTRALGSRWLRIKSDEHVALFTRSSVRRALEAAGFGDVRFLRTGKFVTPSFVASISRAHQSVRGMAA